MGESNRDGEGRGMERSGNWGWYETAKTKNHLRGHMEAFFFRRLIKYIFIKEI